MRREVFPIYFLFLEMFFHHFTKPKESVKAYFRSLRKQIQIPPHQTLIRDKPK